MKKALAVPALFALLVGFTTICIRAGDGDFILALTPALVLGALYFAWWVPLRWPLLITTFLALTLENPSDTPACGQWKSPFYEVGAALLVHLNVTLPNYKALVFSGLDVILAYLFIVAAVRYLKRSTIDGPPEADVGPIGGFAAMSHAAAT
ncbi:MAG TPA: hypothetical protein VHS09_06605, partial [Polyangiaceae bacterium]|nr:hypothetical protein [Polyangiaceae bacterium]